MKDDLICLKPVSPSKEEGDGEDDDLRPLSPPTRTEKRPRDDDPLLMNSFLKRKRKRMEESMMNLTRRNLKMEAELYELSIRAQIQAVKERAVKEEEYRRRKEEREEYYRRRQDEREESLYRKKMEYYSNMPPDTAVIIEKEQE